MRRFVMDRTLLFLSTWVEWKGDGGRKCLF